MEVDTKNVFSDPDWNRDAVRDYFDARAEHDEQYLIELKGKLATSNAYETIYDQTLASYYVHNYFRGRTWLSSREDFLRALADLETAIVPSDDYFEKKRFATFRFNLIHSLSRAASPAQ
jgi:hypothetical protein